MDTDLTSASINLINSAVRSELKNKELGKMDYLLRIECRYTAYYFEYHPNHFWLQRPCTINWNPNFVIFLVLLRRNLMKELSCIMLKLLCNRKNATTWKYHINLNLLSFS